VSGETWLAGLRQRLAPIGLDPMGVVDVAVWDAQCRPETRSEVIAPGAQSIVVVASGGASLWEAFVAACRADAAVLLESAHPLDAFVRRVIEGVAPDHPWFYAAHDAVLPLDFRSLAVLAGLGAPSRLGLVLDARFGPWLGLRAAAFVPFALPASAPAPDLCRDCDAPCISACPGEAFVDRQWSVGRCAAWHQSSSDCERSCAAREACPVGAEHTYPPLERLYHYNRSVGRAALRAELGIPAADDSHAGSGPYWDAWSAD
jgi:epoxyqueuosine reductase